VLRLDPQVAQTSYLNGSFVVPGNPVIVHHALVFTDPAGASRALVTDQATQSYDCFGGPNVSQTALLAAWAPGGLPTDYPSNVGAQLDPGTLLVMQVHYHPHVTTALPPSDQTHFQMRLTSTKPEYFAYTILPGNFSGAVDGAGDGLLPGPDDPASGPAFVIPAGASDHTETMQFTFPATFKKQPLPSSLPIFAIGGHEHYVGSAVQVNVHHANPPAGTPADQCLLAIPRWDFDWQRLYRYDQPIPQLPAVGPGDVMTIRCSYDNSLDNPKLAASLAEQGLAQPQTVKLGETTLDEMCLAPAVLLVQAP
jgi:Copper type II ascorbate-dependent monooxygenase, N-terminal domain